MWTFMLKQMTILFWLKVHLLGKLDVHIYGDFLHVTGKWTLFQRCFQFDVHWTNFQLFYIELKLRLNWELRPKLRMFTLTTPGCEFLTNICNLFFGFQKDHFQVILTIIRASKSQESYHSMCMSLRSWLLSHGYFLYTRHFLLHAGCF